MVVGIICIFFELIMMAYILMRIKKSKQISLKDTAVYPFLVLVSAILIFVGSLKYGGVSVWYKAIPGALSGALSLLTMKLDTDLASALYDKNFVLFVAYFIAYIISALALFSLSVSLFKVKISNLLKVKFFNKETTYVASLTNDAKTFIRNLSKEQRKKTIVLLPKNYEKSYKDEKLFLDDEKVKFIICSFEKKKAFDKTVRRLTRSRITEKYCFVSFFEEEQRIYRFIENAKAYVKEKKTFDGRLQFIINTSPSQNAYVKRLIEGQPASNDKEKRSDESRGCIRCYDKYAIMAFDFILKNNLAHSFPQQLIHDDATVENCDVNLFVIGFGKVNQALLKDVLINTQFVTKTESEKGKFELRPIRLNVSVFDENKNSSDLQLSSGLMKYSKAAFDQSRYFELPEDYRSHIEFYNEINAEGISCFDTIFKIVSEQKRKNKKPIVNYYIVSIGTDFENVAIAEKLTENVQLDDVYNVAYIRTENAIVLKDYDRDRIIPFGDKKTVLSYDNVIADKLYADAKIQSCVYWQKPTDPASVAAEWASLSKIKQESNLYAVASVPFKKSLLKIRGNETDKETFERRYDPARERDAKATRLQDQNGEIERAYAYLSPSASFYPRDVIAYSEHERWLAFEMSLGVVPMEHEKIKDLKTNKSANELEHACLCTSQGLLKYYEKMEEYKQSDPKIDCYSDVIRYDFDLMDNVLDTL